MWETETGHLGVVCGVWCGATYSVVWRALTVEGVPMWIHTGGTAKWAVPVHVLVQDNALAFPLHA